MLAASRWFLPDSADAGGRAEPRARAAAATALGDRARWRSPASWWRARAGTGRRSTSTTSSGRRPASPPPGSPPSRSRWSRAHVGDRLVQALGPVRMVRSGGALAAAGFALALVAASPAAAVLGLRAAWARASPPSCRSSSARPGTSRGGAQPGARRRVEHGLRRAHGRAAARRRALAELTSLPTALWLLVGLAGVVAALADVARVPVAAPAPSEEDCERRGVSDDEVQHAERPGLPRGGARSGHAAARDARRPARLPGVVLDVAAGPGRRGPRRLARPRARPPRQRRLAARPPRHLDPGGGGGRALAHRAWASTASSSPSTTGAA